MAPSYTWTYNTVLSDHKVLRRTAKTKVSLLKKVHSHITCCVPLQVMNSFDLGTYPANVTFMSLNAPRHVLTLTPCMKSVYKAIFDHEMWGATSRK